jgi:hypothetical protein
LTPEQTKLAQVFDDTRRTYLTFDVQVPLGLLIFDESGRPVTFTVGERTVIVAGVRAGLLVRTPTRSSYAQAPKRPDSVFCQSMPQSCNPYGAVAGSLLYGKRKWRDRCHVSDLGSPSTMS